MKKKELENEIKKMQKKIECQAFDLVQKQLKIQTLTQELDDAKRKLDETTRKLNRKKVQLDFVISILSIMAHKRRKA